MMWPYEVKPKEQYILFTSKEDAGWYLFNVAGLGVAVVNHGPSAELISSCLGHICPHFEEGYCQLLGLTDSIAGLCWWCKGAVPEDVHSLWMLHNFDAVQLADPEAIKALKTESRITPKQRKEYNMLMPTKI